MNNSRMPKKIAEERRFVAYVPAKVNLSLVITGRRGGLHTIKSVVCPSRAFEDCVTFVPFAESGIEVTDAYDGFEPERFAAFFEKKAAAILGRAGATGRLYISKHIPLGAGLGGSSACIVGALGAVRDYLQSKGRADEARAMCEDKEFLLSLGSDVPAMLMGGACLVTGVGECVTPLAMPSIDFDIRVAEGGSDSGACYRLYDELPMPLALLPEPESVEEAVDAERNDLTAAACNLNPKIGALIAEMRSSYDRVVMSGSGSAVVGIVKK